MADKNASDYAYVPDKDEPSTWKLNISDSTHTSGAVAALGKGYRGNKVEIPEADLPAVKKKVKAAYKKFFPDNEVPDILKSVDDSSESETTLSVLTKLTALIEKHFGGSKTQVAKAVEVTKSIDEEQKMALFVVLQPDVEDLQGDIYTAAEVEKACNSFNTTCNKANLFHRVQTEKAKISQSYISPADFELDDGRMITKGTWLQWWDFSGEDETTQMLWKCVKDGEINGLSIGAYADAQEVE